MVDELLQYAIAAGFLAYAGLCDIETRRIPNILCGSFAAVGIIFAWLNNTLFAALYGAIFMYLLGAFFFYHGQLGGGDVKLLGALGTYYGMSWPVPTGIMLWFIGIFINTMILVAAYSAYTKKLHRALPFAPLIFVFWWLANVTASLFSLR